MKRGFIHNENPSEQEQHILNVSENRREAKPMSNSKYLYLMSAAIGLILSVTAPAEAQQRVKHIQYEPNIPPQTVFTESGEFTSHRDNSCNNCNTRHSYQRSRCDRKVCSTHAHECSENACEVSPVPHGTLFNAILDLQKARGRAALMVLYHYDFQRNGDLNIYGKRRLERIARHLPSNPFPIIIQRDHSNQSVNESRRRAVLQELSMQKFPVPAERVVIGRPPARSGHGVDAEVMYQKMLSLDAGGSGGGATSGGAGAGVTGGGGGR